MDLSGRMIDSRYQVGSLLGKGAMGEVYLAQDILQEKAPVALKVVQCSNSQLVQNFKNEFELLTLISHPNIIRVMDFGFDEEQGIFYFSTEYIKGNTLGELLREGRIFSEKEALDIAICLGRAVDFIHSRGIVHRDIKPGNIMLIENKLVKLMDFGLAGIFARDDRVSGGTLSYAAPEALSGKADHRSDIYQLGIVILEIMTGHRLFDGIAPANIIDCLKDPVIFEEHRHKALNKLGEMKFSKILHKMTCFSVADRYRCCADFITDGNRIFGKDYSLETSSTIDSYFYRTAHIGRHEEYLILKENITDASGSRIFLIKGQEGLGKDRLVYEIKRFCQLSRIQFFEGRCPDPDTDNLSAITDILDDIILYADESILKETGSEIIKLFPHNEKFKGLKKTSYSDPWAAKEVLMDSISSLIISYAAKSERPCIIYLRDFHRAGKDVRDIVRMLCYKLAAEESSGLRIILSINPGINPQSDFIEFLGTNQIHHVNIILKPFGLKEIGSYTESLFGKSKTGQDIFNISGYLLEKSSGIPAYLQEIFRELINLGYIVKESDSWRLSAEFDESVRIPGLNQLLKKRINNARLTPDQKTILHYMAICSRNASAYEMALYTGIMPKETVDALKHLSEKGLISPVENQEKITYTFNNPGMKECIMEEANPSLTVNFHEKIAVVLEGLYGGSSQDVCETIAYHYSMSGDIKKAADYLVLSGEWSDKLYMFENSIKLYKKALEFIDETDIIRVAGVCLKTAAGYLNIDMRKESLEFARKAFALSQKADDSGLQNRSRFACAQVYAKIGEIQKARDLFFEIRDFYSGGTRDDMLSAVYNELGNLYWSTGEYDNVHDNFLKVIDIASLNRDKKSTAKAYNNIGLIMFHRGETIRAKQYFEKCLDHGLKENDEILIHTALGNMGLIHWRSKEYEKALECFEKKLDIARKLGLKREISASLVNIADILSDRGDYSRAVDIYKEQIALTRLINDRYLNAITGINLGTVYKEMGDIKGAFATLQEARIASKEIDHKELQSVALINLGDIYKIFNNFEMADKCYNEAISIAERIKLKIYMPYYYLTKSDLAFQQGEHEKCLEYSQKGIKVSEDIKDMALIFDLRVSALKAEYYIAEDDEKRDEIILGMKQIARNASQDRELALISYELFVLKGNFFWGYSALNYYRRLYSRIPKYEYRNKLEDIENKLRLKFQDISSDEYITGIFYEDSLQDMEQSEIVHNFTDLDTQQKIDYFASEIIYLSSRSDSLKANAGKISTASNYIKYLVKNLVKYQPDERGEDEKDKAVPVDADKEISSIITGNTERDVRNVEMLLEAVRASSSTLDVNILLIRIMDMILRVTEAERGFIMLKDKADNKLKISVKRAKNIEDGEIAEDFSRSIPQKVLESGSPVCLKDAAIESATTSMLDLDLRSVMCVPLEARNYRFGVIYVDSHSALKEFSDKDLSFFSALTSQIAGAIENARLYKEAVELGEKIQKYNEELLKSEETLRQSKFEVETLKNLLNNVINSIPSIILAVDYDTRIIMWNTAASRFTGCEYRDVKDQCLMEALPYFDKYRINIDTVIKEHKTIRLFREGIDFPNQAGAYYDIMISPLKGGRSEGAVFRIEDITELEKKNQQLIQAQKLEIVGTLASGLAHDFNNVLGVLVGSISLIRIKIDAMEKEKRDKLSEYLDSMNTAIEKAKELIIQLMKLTKRDKTDFSTIDLNKSLNTVASLCSAGIDKSINFRYRLYHAPAYIKGNASQIEQALLNLVINSMHAMTIMQEGQTGTGNNLTLGIKDFEADDNFCQIYGDAVKGNYWVISITDEGVGMDSQTIAKIFDPFYSTKSKDIGTGLGLFMVYDIIKKHNGIINVESSPGHGTTFEIYIPRADNPD